MKKPILITLIILSLLNANGQRLKDAGEPVIPATDMKVLPGGSCHWAYSIRRTNETSDGRYYYQITFSLAQLDSGGNPAGIIKMNNAKIICSFKLSTKKYSVPFFPNDDVWVAKFFIKTYRAVPLNITVEYFNQKSMIKEPILNSGRYPGED